MFVPTMTMHIVTWQPPINIQWGCGICFEFINGYVSKICDHVQSHQKKSSKEQSQSSCRKDEDEVLCSPSDSISSDKEV